MKVKQRSDDFRVRELLAPEVLIPRGEHRVYRVVKSKLTSFEAARALANEAGANAGDVTMCGLKDRQGVTLQHMALRHGPQVKVRTPSLRIETVGFSSEPLDSKCSEGNAFEIVLRGMRREDLDLLRANAHALKERGLVNYFDDQRFGNLKHGQGWLALELIRGEHEHALRTLLTARSPWDDRKAQAFKRALDSYWGDWRACRDIAGKFGEHHSLFEHLKHEPQDFAGAFFHVSSRLRLIHLYAYQSHLWNRAVADFVRARVEPRQRVVLDSAEGPLVYPEADVEWNVADDATFRLPGPKLSDVGDPEQRDLLADALAHDRLVPAQFHIDGVSGFQLKGEDRALLVTPRHLRLRPARPDALNRGAMAVEVRFELPRGAYATLVVRRLLQTSASRSEVAAPRARAPERAPRREDRPPRRRSFDGPGFDGPRRDDRPVDRRSKRLEDPDERDARHARAEPERPISRRAARGEREERRFDDRRFDERPAARFGERAPQRGRGQRSDRPWEDRRPRERFEPRDDAGARDSRPARLAFGDERGEPRRGRGPQRGAGSYERAPRRYDGPPGSGRGHAAGAERPIGSRRPSVGRGKPGVKRPRKPQRRTDQER